MYILLCFFNHIVFTKDSVPIIDTSYDARKRQPGRPRKRWRDKLDSFSKDWLKSERSGRREGRPLPCSGTAQAHKNYNIFFYNIIILCKQYFTHTYTKSSLVLVDKELKKKISRGTCSSDYKYYTLASVSVFNSLVR